MPDLVRVKDNKTGHEFSWPADLVEGVEGISVLDKPAVGPDGEAVVTKHKTSVRKQAAAKDSASKSAQAESKKGPTAVESDQ